MTTSSYPTFKESLARLIKLLRLDRSDINTIYLYSILTGLLYLVLPLGIQFIISFIMAGAISTSAIVLMIIIVVAIFFSGLLQIKQLEIIEKIEQKLFVRYSFKYADSLASIDLLKIDEYYLPELVNRFFEISTLQKSIYKLLIDVPGAAIQIVFGTLLLSFYHPVFIGFGLLLLTLVFFIIWTTSTRGLTSALTTSNIKFETGAFIEELARNILSYKFNKSSNFHLKKTDEIVSGYINSKTTHFRILKIQYWSLIFFKIIIVAVMLILGINLLIRQEINLGQFIAADIVIIAIIASVEKFISSFDTLYDALTSLQKLEKITLAEKEKEGSQLYTSKGHGPSVEFQQVRFSYANNFTVLKDFSLKILPQQWVCINGVKGSGKSSILNLLSGSYKVDEGNILIDDLPIANYNLNSLRSQFGVLLQYNNVFKGKLLENITYVPAVSDLSELQELSLHTGLSKYITNSSHGWDEEIDTCSRRIPAPFLHSILLTRALYDKPDILLLEDPFQYLSESETLKIVDFIKKYIRATVLIVNNGQGPTHFYDHIVNINS